MRKRRYETATMVLVCGGLAGLLLWSKLRLVSDLPRSAYADPMEILPADGGDDGSAGGAGSEAPGTGAGAENTARDESEN